MSGRSTQSVETVHGSTTGASVGSVDSTVARRQMQGAASAMAARAAALTSASRSAVPVVPHIGWMFVKQRPRQAR